MGAEVEEVSVEFEYIPGLVDVVHDGKLPTAQGWQDSLLAMDTLAAALRTEIAQIDDRMGVDPGADSCLAADRKNLEDKLRIAMGKREMIEGAIRAGLVSDVAQVNETATSATRAAGDQE